jgi:hypothetical protein
MIVSKANSIRFYEVNDLMSSFDNTKSTVEPFENHLMYSYRQVYYNTDIIRLQVKCSLSDTPTLKVWDNGAWSAPMSGVVEVSYPTEDIKIIEYPIDFSTFISECIYFKVEGDTETYKSEVIQILTEEDGNLLQIEWYNSDSAFEIDYSTDISFMARIRGLLKDYEPQGEIKTYNNQGELSKLKEIVIRALNLQTEMIARYMVETLTIAMAHDKFYINEVEYITENKPDVRPLKGSNLSELSNILTQRNVIGVNSHDIGFDSDVVGGGGMTEDSEIGKANSIAFIRQDSNDANFDNTLFAERPFENHLLYRYTQKFISGDTPTIHVKTKDGVAIPTITAIKQDYTNVNIIPTLIATYTDFKIYTFNIDMSLYGSNFRVKVVAGSDTWMSEPIEVITDIDYFLMLEWFNFDNAFDCEYSTGLTHFIRIEGILKDYEPGGEMSLYDNQGELTKLKEVVIRVLRLETGVIPDYLAEKIRVAMAHDKFFVNDIEYVSDSLPDITSLNFTNFKELAVSLVQRNVLGINTHDIGFDVDAMATCTMVKVLEDLNASGNIQFAIPTDHMIHTVTVFYNAGSGLLVKAGSTPGGNEVIYGIRPDATDDNITVNIHQDFQGISTLYMSITGTAADLDIYVQLIKNRPA